MDTTSILTKTAQGMLAAKAEGGDLNYDAVRLLRRVDGKASVGALRAQFADITDTRFEKALAMLEKKSLIRALAPEVQPMAERLDAPKLDAQMHELAQELLQTLDFTTLERKLVEAMRSPQPKPGVAAIPTVPQQPRADQQVAEAEARASLMSVLRPQVE